MAIIEKGFMGGFRGKIGNIVGCKYKNGFYIRQLPAKSLKPPTEKQLANRERFKLAQGFIADFRKLNKALPDDIRGALKCSQRQLMQQAIDGGYPGQTLNYSKIRLTTGYTPYASDHTARYEQPGILFSWTDPMPAHYFSFAVLLAYNPAEHIWMYKVAKTVSALREVIHIPADFPAGYVETWLFFLSHDYRQVSTAVHTGSILLPEPAVPNTNY